MATATFQRPENALKRCEELISVGQKSEALNVLHSTISHRKLRTQGWDFSAELIMMKHIKLCVELEKLKLVREGLHFYRYLTQQQNVLALAKAMRELRDLSEEKLEAVKSKISSDQAATEAIADDLEADETPESLLLSTLQVEVRDKSAEELHTALLGCWESYKIIMDLLRYAPKIDYLYHETAQKALEFCRVNNRTQEFRRLCETLRTHYLNFQKQRGRPDFEGFLRPEAHLPTRLTQLGAAADLNLWSQCFQTAEDILALGLHELLQRSLSDKDSSLHKHRGLLLQQTAIFYEKLAMIFRVADQPVFHGSAVLRNLFHTRQHKKTVSKDEQVRLCDVGTLAVLCVPVTDQTGQTTADLEYQRKLASMLGHGGIPTRASMKGVIEAQGIVASASSAVQSLYNLIEGDINPLTVCEEALQSIRIIEASPSLKSYIPALKRVVFDKLIIKLSKIYTSLLIDFFTQSLCPESFIPWGEAETIIVQLVHQSVIQLRLDYSRRAILFGSAASSPDPTLRNRPVQIARVLSGLVPKMKLPGRKEPSAALHDAFYAGFESKLESESIRLKNRNTAVAERRKKQEADEEAKEYARRREEQEKQKKEVDEELARREAALKHQEEIRRREEQQQQKLEIARQIVGEFKAIAEKANGKIIIEGKAIDEITPEDIINHVYDYEHYEKAQEELRNRERQEKGRQRRLETKRVEHLVRALREEEAPALEAWKENTRKTDMAFLAEVQTQEEEEKKRQWGEAQELRQIFIDIKPYKDAWCAEQKEQREVLWEKQKQDRFARIKQVLKLQKIERARARRQVHNDHLRLEEEQREREVQERQRIEEEKRRAEEKERQRIEEEKRRAEEKERDEALRRSTEKQKLKELEIDRKQQESKEEIRRAEEQNRNVAVGNIRGSETEISRSNRPPRTAPLPATSAAFRPEPRAREPEAADENWRRGPPATQPLTAERNQPPHCRGPSDEALRRRPETANWARGDSGREKDMSRRERRGENGDVDFSRDQMRTRDQMSTQARPRIAQTTNEQRRPGPESNATWSNPPSVHSKTNTGAAPPAPAQPTIDNDGFTTVTGKRTRGGK